MHTPEASCSLAICFLFENLKFMDHITFKECNNFCYNVWFFPFPYSLHGKWNNKYKEAQVTIDLSSKHVTSYLGAQEGVFFASRPEVYEALISEGILEST